jgi:hypothetical protein
VTRTRTAILAAVCTLAAACATGGGVLASTEGTTSTTATTAAPATTTTTTTLPRDCSPRPDRLPQDLNADDPVAVSIALSEATFRCADEVTVAPIAGGDTTRRAALHATAAEGPRLLVGTDLTAVAAEIERLDPRIVTLAGSWDTADPVFEGREIRTLRERLGIRSSIVQGSGSRRLLVVGPDAAWPAVWAAASAAGDTAVLVDDADLRDLPDAKTAALRSAPGADATLLGTGADAEWQLAVVRSGTELPGGGLLVFPSRRLVAFYGQPETPVLGVLGEQGIDGAEATIERMAPIVAVPAFEIIATVASAQAGADGDYSYETPVEILRPWVETAAEHGVYVILDLQPGRTDFLTQAKRYEELIRLPNVGVAIDPEWRLGPNQIHLQQIGSVDVAEINAVADWMAGIVRDEALPQKVLLLHQFQIRMIPERDQVVLHPELAITVQMDGQGALATKYGTWAALTTTADAARFWWGWKNFYDEDVPMATPAEVLDLTPVVYLVSFQ